jgi:hypothetical protein
MVELASPMSIDVVVPLVAAALGAFGGWISSYVLKRRDDRILGEAAERQLELELTNAENTIRTVLPDGPLESHGGKPIADWGEHNDWQLTTWDNSESRNHLAIRLRDENIWTAVSKTVMRLNNLASWVKAARSSSSRDAPPVRTATSVADQVKATQQRLAAHEDTSRRRRVVLSVIVASALLIAVLIPLVLEATDVDLNEATVAQELAQRVRGESLVNCDAVKDVHSTWDCAVVYDGCNSHASLQDSDCDPGEATVQEKWEVTADSDTLCTSARLDEIWRTDEPGPRTVKELTGSVERVTGDNC